MNNEELRLDIGKISRDGKALVAASIGDRVIARDVLNLNAKKARQEFAEEVAPDNREYQEEITQKLMEASVRRNGQLEKQDSSVTVRQLEFSELRNAERFAEQYHDRFRFHPSLGWLAWDKTRWVVGDDALPHVYGVAREFVRQLHTEVAGTAAESYDLASRNAKRAASKAGLTAFLELASKDERIWVHPADLDADDTLFNTENGTVNLETGERRPHNPRDLITRIAGTHYDLQATCPLWERTLAEIFEGEDQDEVISYLQRLFGYGLSGSVREEIFALLWGSGRNGKGTICETYHAVLGSYGATASMMLFLESGNDSSRLFEIAEMPGVRVTFAAEANEDRPFDTAAVKRWTGGDMRKCAKKHKPHFEYAPKDLLLISVNAKPRVRGWDVAFQERVHLVPFEREFSDDNIDRERKRKLRDELPGILMWCLQGYLDYRKEGLNPPARVCAAVEEY